MNINTEVNTLQGQCGNRGARPVTRGSHPVATLKAVQAQFLLSPRESLSKRYSARLDSVAPSLPRVMILATQFLMDFTSWRRW